MTPIATPGYAIVYAGQDTARADILTHARQHLIAQGIHHLQVDDILVDRQGLVAAAWWAGDTVGFCQPDHPQATPVTVVNIPPPEALP